MGVNSYPVKKDGETDAQFEERRGRELSERWPTLGAMTETPMAAVGKLQARIIMLNDIELFKNSLAIELSRALEGIHKGGQDYNIRTLDVCGVGLKLKGRLEIERRKP